MNERWSNDDNDNNEQCISIMQQQQPRQQQHPTAVVKAVLFDLDGTLLDTEALSDRANIQAFQQFGVTVPSDVLIDHRLPWSIKKQILGLPGHEWVPMVLKYAKDHWLSLPDNQHLSQQQLPSVDKFWKCWESNLNNLCDQVEACHGATELVQQLAAHNIPMAIATSSRSAAVAKKRIRHEAIFQYISAIVTADDPAIQHGKPAPDIYIEAARRLGIPSHHCLVVEDASAGVQAGKAAGCFVVAVPDVRFTPQDKTTLFAPHADVVLDDLTHFDGTMFGIPVNMTTVTTTTTTTTQP